MSRDGRHPINRRACQYAIDLMQLNPACTRMTEKVVEEER